jgi:hypothetical protein
LVAHGLPLLPPLETRKVSLLMRQSLSVDHRTSCGKLEDEKKLKLKTQLFEKHIRGDPKTDFDYIFKSSLRTKSSNFIILVLKNQKQNFERNFSQGFVNFHVIC